MIIVIDTEDIDYLTLADELAVHLPEPVQPYALRMVTDTIHTALGIKKEE